MLGRILLLGSDPSLLETRAWLFRYAGLWVVECSTEHELISALRGDEGFAGLLIGDAAETGTLTFAVQEFKRRNPKAAVIKLGNLGGAVPAKNVDAVVPTDTPHKMVTTVQDVLLLKGKAAGF